MSMAMAWRREWWSRRAARSDSKRALSVPREGDFCDRLRDRAGLASKEEAEHLARASFSCLLARLSIPLQLRVRHELPRRLAGHLRNHPTEGSRFEPVETYFEQVAQVLGPKARDARTGMLAAGTELAELLPKEVLAEIAAEVPQLFRALFPERAEMARPPVVSRLRSAEVVPLYRAPTTTPSYLGLRWTSSSQTP